MPAPSGLSVNVRVSTDTAVLNHRGSVDASFDFDLSNMGTIRLLRESCGEVSKTLTVADAAAVQYSLPTWSLSDPHRLGCCRSWQR
jgi:hypothetical protein